MKPKDSLNREDNLKNEGRSNKPPIRPRIGLPKGPGSSVTGRAKPQSAREGAPAREGGFKRSGTSDRTGEFKRSTSNRDVPPRREEGIKRETGAKGGFGRDDYKRGPAKPAGGFKREGSFKRDRLPKWEGSFKRDVAPKREGGFGRDEFKRPAASKRDGGFKREGAPNREGGFKGESFNRTVGPKREGGFRRATGATRNSGFKRDDYKSEDSPRREGGYKRESPPKVKTGYPRKGAAKFEQFFNREGGAKRALPAGGDGATEHKPVPRRDNYKPDRPNTYQQGERQEGPRSSGGFKREGSPKPDAPFTGVVRRKREHDAKRDERLKAQLENNVESAGTALNSATDAPAKASAQSAAIYTPPPNAQASATSNEPHSSGLPKLMVSFGDTRSTRLRHTWIYDNMVADASQCSAADGTAVAVIEQPNKFLGSAIYNSASVIRGRLFSLEALKFDERYITRAIEAAITRRRVHFAADDSYRVVFADSDGIPGLIVDKMANVLVIQLLTLAADRHSKHIVTELQRLLAPAGIVVRTDSKVRQKEGLPVTAPVVIGDVPVPISVLQDGFTVHADLLAGQKTGLFLDQRFNRHLIRPWCKDACVLDLYCYVGAWSFTAAAHGAREVTGVDSSAAATTLAARGAETNGYSNVSFVTSDVFEFFDANKGSEYDVIVCDPPAFAKTRAHITEAMKGYLSLNYRCMKSLPVGGVLATSSCSQHVGVEEFEAMLETAARNARMRFQILARASQAPDHPPLLGFPESEYLKCFLLLRTE